MSNTLNFIKFIFLGLLLCINLFKARADIPNVAIGQDKVVEIPFEYVGGLIVIKAKVNGVEGRFVFDNGATHSCFNKDFARKSGVSFKKRTTITDANNRRLGILSGQVKKMEISSASFSKVRAFLIDTNRFFPCDPIDGIIGASIINTINWKIDFDQQKMKMSLVPFKSNGQKLPITIGKNESSFINFTIKRQSLKTKVDLGYKGELKIRKSKKLPFLKGIEMEKNIGVSSISVSGLGKIDTTYIIYRKAELRYQNNPLTIVPKITFTKHLKYQARIGLDYFKNYNLIINSRQREYILSNPKERSSAIEKSYGIRIYKVKDAFKIISIKTNENFPQAIQLMNEITAIDNITVNKFKNLCEFKDYVDNKAKKEKSITIKLKDKPGTFTIPYKTPKLKTF